MDVMLLFIPILTTFAFGFLCRVTGYFSQDVCERLIEYLMKVPIPIAIFYALTKIELSTLSSMHHFIFIYVLVKFAFLGGGFLFFRMLRFSCNMSVSYASAIFSTNTVFFALPIFLSMPVSTQGIYMPVFAIGIAIHIGLFALVIMPMYQIGSGVLTMASVKRVVVDTLQIPLVLAVIIGTLFFLFGLSPATQVEHMLASSGAILSSTGLVALGMCMDYRFFTRFNPVVWSAIIAKSVLMPLAAIGLMQWFPLDAQHTFAMVIMTACPATGLSAMAAKQYSDVSDHIIDIMVGSTVVSILTFPYWISLAHLI
jgi:malonate transporter